MTAANGEETKSFSGRIPPAIFEVFADTPEPANGDFSHHQPFHR
jgi:hypothetical protein